MAGKQVPTAPGTVIFAGVEGIIWQGRPEFSMIMILSLPMRTLPVSL